MGELVALALPGGPAFVDALTRTWDDGNAIFPLDPRLPQREADLVMKTVRPTAIIEADGEKRSLDGGLPVEPGDAVVVATSGTTGAPKGVIHTHDSVRASAEATSTALDIDPATDVWLACLPLAHIGGLAVVMRSLVTGTGLIVHDGFDPHAVAAASTATVTSLVTRALTQIDTDAFRTVLIGGAAPPSDRPANVIATYGMTETGSGCIYERGPLDGVEIRIDAGAQIHLRAPMLARSYRTLNPDDGSTSHADLIDRDGWFPTGDLGHWGDDGLIRVDGRAGDVIVTGGEKVWPARVEPLLAAQPGVSEVALIGRPHPEWGHEAVAVIVATDSTNGTDGALPDLEQLRSAVKAELPAWYAPRRIELVSELPKTSLGKIRRAEL